jgi:hypothetical protein
LNLPLTAWWWTVYLSSAARVRDLAEEVLAAVLRDLESAGRRYVSGMGDYWDPAVRRLRDLGIESVHGLDPGPERAAGAVKVMAGVYGQWEWPGSKVDTRLTDVFASQQGANKVLKLARADAAQRHLVVVLDSPSAPGLGIPLGLTSRHELGAEYEMPSVEPPAPVTHVWLIPTPSNSEGLMWVQQTGWGVIPSI